MFSQNSVGTVYYISINKGRPEAGTQYSMREANERRPQIFVFEKDGTNAFLAEVTNMCMKTHIQTPVPAVHQRHTEKGT